MAVRNFLQGDRRRYTFFLCKFAAWRDGQPEIALERSGGEPGIVCRVSPFSWSAGLDFCSARLQECFRSSKICAVDALSTIRTVSIARIRPQESARCRDRSCVRCKRPMLEWGRAGISSVDILPPGFGDANVATKHKQSNRRD